MYRLIYRCYRLWSGARYRLGRRFTTAGLLIFWGAIAAGIMGLDTENTVAYQAFSVLAFLVLFAFFSSWIFKIKFSAHRNLPRFGTVGLPMRYSVTVKNLSSRPQAGLTLLEELSDPRPGYPEWRRAHRAADKR